MSKKVTLSKEFVKGLWENNPVFKQVLGMCPTLAVTVSAINGIAMALATTFVLVFSSFIVSLIRKMIPAQVRIAAYILIIATFVTIVDLVMKAQFAELSKSLRTLHSFNCCKLFNSWSTRSFLIKKLVF